MVKQIETKVSTIKALKPSSKGEGYSVVCDIDDKDASIFQLQWSGRFYSAQSIAFDTLFKAEEVQSALHDVFRMGKNAAKIELTNWMQSRG